MARGCERELSSAVLRSLVCDRALVHLVEELTAVPSAWARSDDQLTILLKFRHHARAATKAPIGVLAKHLPLLSLLLVEVLDTGDDLHRAGAAASLSTAVSRAARVKSQCERIVELDCSDRR